MTTRVAILLAVVISAVAAIPNLSVYDKINSLQDSWTAGHNEISDKSWEEKKQLCGSLLSKPEDSLPVKDDIEIVENIPATFDARTHWSKCPIDYIKNQGQCGSCWAVGAASAASDRLCISSQGKIRVNVSVENLMTCCSECVVTGGCDGGYHTKAWQYLQSTGVVTGGDYDSNQGCQPYQIAPTSSDYYTPPCSKKCTNKKYGRAYNKDLHYDQSAYTLPAKNVKAIQSEILKNGPVEASFLVYEDFFDYQKGVYVHTSQILAGRHAVRVLGWGKENGKNYWLVANSWGRTWGKLGGYFKILRGTDECEFEEQVAAGLAKS